MWHISCAVCWSNIGDAHGNKHRCDSQTRAIKDTVRADAYIRIIQTHVQGNYKKRLSPVHSHKEMHVKERKL